LIIFLYNGISRHVSKYPKPGRRKIAVKEIIPERLNMIPTGNFLVKDSDILILLGPNDSLSKLQEITS